MPEIVLTADLSNIENAMNFLAGQIPPERCDLKTHVELAVEELFVNVASYAYPVKDAVNGGGKIVLGCRWVTMDGEQQFCVWLRDWGLPFNPFISVDQPDTDLGIEQRNLGGLGVHLVRHITSHYVYSGTDGSNTVELYFSDRLSKA